MREAPIILPVFTTSVPLDFPSEGTFAFNKKTNKQLEVTVRINEHQYFNINFLNHDGYIMHAADGRMCWTLQRMVMTVTNRSSKNISGRNILLSAVCMDSILIRLRTFTYPPSVLRGIPRNGTSPCASMGRSSKTCCMVIS